MCVTFLTCNQLACLNMGMFCIGTPCIMQKSFSLFVVCDMNRCDVSPQYTQCVVLDIADTQSYLMMR